MSPVSPMRQTPILLATSNPDKQQALQTILDGLSLSPVTPGQIGLEFNPEECGETHLEVTMEKVRRKFGTDLTLNLPKVAYKETITTVARAEYKHRKQTGGHGQYVEDLWRPTIRGRPNSACCHRRRRIFHF